MPGCGLKLFSSVKILSSGTFSHLECANSAMILIANFISDSLQFAKSGIIRNEDQFQPIFTSHAELPGRDKAATVLHACKSGEAARWK